VQFSVEILHGRYDTAIFDLMVYGIFGHCENKCFFLWHLEKDEVQLKILRWVKDFLNYRGQRIRGIQFSNKDLQRRYRSWIVDAETFLFLARFNGDRYLGFLEMVAENSLPPSTKTSDVEALYDIWKKLLVDPNWRF